VGTLRNAVEDADLVQAALRGDRLGLGVLLERHRARLQAAALAILGSPDEAQDAVHETFLAALLHLREVRDPLAAGGWLMATLRTRCLMELRRRTAADRGLERGAWAMPEGEAPAAERRMEQNALRDWLWTALAKLGEGQRLAVLLRHFGSYRSYGEIAAILGVPVGTVRSRLSEARQRLGGLLLDRVAEADGEARRLASRRRRTYLEAFRGLYRGGREPFLSLFDPEVLVRWGTAATARGRRHLAADVDGDIAAGVEFRPRRVVSSGALTIVEGVFENPPQDPHHCPPAASMVMRAAAPEAPNTRLHIHFAGSLPAGGEDEEEEA
jgi:RNA polymerase sigma-70 factor (ECF subfamily)